MTKQKRKLIATFKGPITKAFENDRVELTGKYRKGVYELYMMVEAETFFNVHYLSFLPLLIHRSGEGVLTGSPLSGANIY